MAETATRDRDETDDAASTKGSHGSFCWNELTTHDVARAKQFYADTIGWTFDPMPMDWGTYWLAKAGDKMAGGLIEMQGDCAAMPENWMPYLAVDDVDARLKRGRRRGRNHHA